MKVLLLMLTLFGALPLLAQSPSDVSNASAVLGAPKGRPLTGEALETETRRVALLLRCPVCQGVSVADSPSSMARNMRDQVKQLVAAGYDEDQVLRYFERSYGEFVRLQPPLAGVNWIVWLAPIVGLVAGAAFVAWTLRQPAAAPVAVQAIALDALPDDAELARYVLRVRERAYGWPGGVRPVEPA